MDLAFIQGLDNVRINIHAKDIDSMCGKGGGGRETDIAKSDDTNLLKFH